MWEIYAYHNSAALFGLFNAIAALMQAEGYKGALAAVAFCGFVAAFVAYAFAPERLQGWKWLGTVTLVSSIFIVPHVSVVIVDKVGSTPNQQIDNVPLGLAALASLTSTVGHTMTDLFETAFQVIPGKAELPVELAYQHNGLMFGSRLIQGSRGVDVADPATRSDLINFVANCTNYDIADGTIKPAVFASSDDLWSLMKDTNPARFSNLTTDAGVGVETCDKVYADLDTRLSAQVPQLLDSLGLRMYPSLDPETAKTVIVGSVEQAYIRSNIADASKAAADLIRQNALINAIGDQAELGCQRINDPACMMLATGRASAVAQQNAAWINGGKIAEQALPVVRNVAEAVIYALFPIVVLMLLVSSGKHSMTVFAGYVTAMLGIQLWPPLFAVMNYMATLYAQMRQEAASAVGSGHALALRTASPIYSNAISAQAVVAYLVIGIPVLAQSIASRMVNVGAALAGGLTGLQSTIGNASAGAAVGNANLGNVTMDQRTITPMRSSSFLSRTQTAAGDWHTVDASGRHAISLLQNEGVSSRTVSVRATQNDVVSASRAAEAARTEAVAAISERSAALTELVRRASSQSSHYGSTESTNLTASEELGKSAGEVIGLSNEVSRQTGLSQQQVMRLGFQASLGVPKFLGIGAGLEGGKTYGGELSEREQAALSSMSSSQMESFKRFADRASHDTSFQSSLSHEDQSGRELAARLTQAKSRAERAEAGFVQRQSWHEQVADAYERGTTIQVDIAKIPEYSHLVEKHRELAAIYGANSQALQIAMGSELGSLALRPTMYFRDGSQGLDSADSARSTYARHRAGAAPGAQVDDFHARNVTQVGSSSSKNASPAPKSMELKGLRPSIEGAHKQGHLATDEQLQNFDSRNEISRSADGSVSTSKSLGLNAAIQSVEDAARAFEEVKRALSGHRP